MEKVRPGRLASIQTGQRALRRSDSIDRRIWDQGWYERFIFDQFRLIFELVNRVTFVPRSWSLRLRDGLPIRWFGTFFAVTLPCQKDDQMGDWHADV
jgi:hypothetical protein